MTMDESECQRTMSESEHQMVEWGGTSSPGCWEFEGEWKSVAKF